MGSGQGSGTHEERQAHEFEPTPGSECGYYLGGNMDEAWAYCGQPRDAACHRPVQLKGQTTDLYVGEELRRMERESVSVLAPPTTTAGQTGEVADDYTKPHAFEPDTRHCYAGMVLPDVDPGCGKSAYDPIHRVPPAPDTAAERERLRREVVSLRASWSAALLRAQTAESDRDRLAARVEELEVLLKGAEDRALLALSAKNNWADRARSAESESARLAGELGDERRLRLSVMQDAQDKLDQIAKALGMEEWDYPAQIEREAASLRTANRELGETVERLQARENRFNERAAQLLGSRSVPTLDAITSICTDLVEAEAANRELAEEIARAMAVLNPSMPESGLEDAARQVMQAKIAAMDNSTVAIQRMEAAESANRELVGALERSARANRPQCDQAHGGACDCVGDAARAALAKGRGE